MEARDMVAVAVSVAVVVMLVYGGRRGRDRGRGRGRVYDEGLVSGDNGRNEVAKETKWPTVDRVLLVLITKLGIRMRIGGRWSVVGGQQIQNPKPKPPPQAGRQAGTAARLHLPCYCSAHVHPRAVPSPRSFVLSFPDLIWSGFVLSGESTRTEYS